MVVKAAFDRLQWRIFAFLALSLVLLIGLFAVFFLRFLTGQVIEQAADQSALVADTIHLGLAQNMISNNREEIQLSLQDVLHNPLISEVFISDPEGRVVFSSRPGLVGRNLAHTAFEGLREGKGWRVVEGSAGGREIFRTSPIENRGACQECHSASRSILGHIAVKVSMSGPEKMLRETRFLLAGLAGMLLLLIFVVNARFFAVNVAKPIDRLLERFREVGEGRAEGPGPPGEELRGELGDLSRGFDRLVNEVRTLNEAEKEKEKEFVLLQQDRAHQEELEEMNRQLTTKVEELNEASGMVGKLARQLEERNESLQRAIKNISALNRVGVALSSELDMDRLVTLLINISVKGLRAEIGHIMLLDEERGVLEMKAWTGLGEDFVPAIDVAPGESISGKVCSSGKALLLAEIDGSGEIKGKSRYGYHRRTVISAPIRIKGKMLGVIELANKRGGIPFDEEDLGMMQSIANQAAVAIENANLYHEVQKSYFDTVKALVQAVEENDRYTRGHSERVTTFSVKIAESMGFGEKRTELIRYGGVLHDVGKIGINVNIIQKPGRLTQEEFNIIKNHPLIGERIISPIKFLREVLPIVSQHHERYDGLGYPKGIDGAGMVAEARVLAVADAYDAMITARPYRKPLPREEAIAELKRCSGTQFDPIVVEHFLGILEEDPDIRKLEENLSAVGT